MNTLLQSIARNEYAGLIKLKWIDVSPCYKLREDSKA